MKKRIIYITILILLIGLFLQISRGQNVSNYLKKLILPELENATGKKFISQKIYINLIPLFIEIKDLKCFDDSGNRIISAKRVKGYIGLSGLLNKEIVIKRLVLKDTEINSDFEQAEEITENVKRYLAEESKMPLKVIIKSITIVNGNIGFQDKDISMSAQGVNADIILSITSRFRITSKKIVAIMKDIPEFIGTLDTYMVLKEKHIELERLKITSYGSEFITSGKFGIEKSDSRFHIDTNILMESIKKMFSLEKRGEGNISAKGEIRFDDFKSIDKIYVDLKIKADMYLETLMELLNVREKLAGYMKIDGDLKGNLRDLRGRAKARLQRGNLFGVEVTALDCSVTYNNGIMKFTNGRANLYGGAADVEAMIHLPVVENYSFSVKVKDIDSKGVFKLINWDPMIARGKVSGEITSSGSEFNPYGKFHYISKPEGRDVIDRIKDIRSEFKMQNNIIRFEGMTVRTEKSLLQSDGTVNINRNELEFSGRGTTMDIREILSPYFTAISGTGSFEFSLNGKIEDPLLDLNLTSNNLAIHTSELSISDIVKDRTLRFQSAEGSVSYRKDILNIKKFLAVSDREEYRVDGKVNFHNPRRLFDLKEPYYNLNLSIKNADIRNLSGIFHNAPNFGGEIDAKFSLLGHPDDIKASGQFHSTGFRFNSYLTDQLKGKVSYEKGVFYFKDLKAKRSDSEMQLDGEIRLDGRFLFLADARKIRLSDVLENTLRHKIFESVYFTDTKIKGDGTFKNPVIEITSEIYSEKYDGHSIGKGRIKGTIRDGLIDLVANILDGRLNIKGNAELTEKLPWSAKIEIKPARYDFLIEGFLKDIPEDLLLNLSGNIMANGDRDNINAKIKFTRAHIYLYGIGFTNSADIDVTLNNKRFSINKFSMKSEEAEIGVSGEAVIGKNLDIMINGYSSLSPFKALVKNIETLKGDSSFIFSINGDWNKPKINGGIDISNGVLGFKDIYYRLTSINAYLYIDEDKVIIERASGRLAGGDVKISGIAYLQGFSPRRFFIESRLTNITTTISKDLWINFDGNLYYRGNMESQTILGNINLNKARYSNRIDWKTLILRAKQKDMPKTERSMFQKTNLNVNVIGDKLVIDNNLARASMKLDLLIRGIIGQPVLIGKVETNEGIVYFRNNEFKLLKASLDFSDPYTINPYFDIIAETNIKGYNIRLSLDGYADNFNMALSSSPHLDEMDIFSILTVGRVGKDIKGLEGGIGLSEATSFLTGEFQDIFEERLRTITGFDRVQVDPYVSKTTGTISPRVTLAKRLLGDKLYVTYSTGVGGVTEEQVLQLEYNLTKDIFLIGQRDDRGGMGGDIKFRFEFK